MGRTAWTLLFVGLGMFVLAILGAALVIGTGSGSGPEPQETLTLREQAPTLELPLADDERALLLAQRKGRILVGIAARPGGPVEAAAVAGESAAESLSFAVDGQSVNAARCGQACSRLAVPALNGASHTISVTAEGARFDFRLPAEPLPSGAKLFAIATRRMEALRAYRYQESLTSGVGTGVRSSFEVVPPNRLGFRTADGFRSVIIGRSRWDFRNGRWERSPFPGLQVTYMWDGARNVRRLGQAKIGGQPVAILAAYDREPVTAWFRLYVTPDGRVVRAEMLAPSHFMRQDFSDFNERLTIEPPA